MNNFLSYGGYRYRYETLRFRCCGPYGRNDVMAIQPNGNVWVLGMTRDTTSRHERNHDFEWSGDPPAQTEFAIIVSVRKLDVGEETRWGRFELGLLIFARTRIMFDYPSMTNVAVPYPTVTMTPAIHTSDQIVRHNSLGMNISRWTESTLGAGLVRRIEQVFGNVGLTILPHQLANALLVLAREQTMVSMLQGSKHVVIHPRPEDPNPMPMVFAEGRIDYLDRPRTTTFIADDVGVGKTLSALAIVAAQPIVPDNETRISALIDRTTTGNPLEELCDGHAQCMRRFSRPDTVYFEPRYARLAPGKTLIVVPTNLVEHWARETRRLLPEANVYIYRGKARENLTAEQIGSYDVVIMPNSMIARSFENAKNYRCMNRTRFPIVPDLETFPDDEHVTLYGKVTSIDGPYGQSVQPYHNIGGVSTKVMVKATARKLRECLIGPAELVIDPNDLYRDIMIEGMCVFTRGERRSPLLYFPGGHGEAPQGVIRFSVSGHLRICGSTGISRECPTCLRRREYDVRHMGDRTSVQGLHAPFHVRWERVIVDECHLYRAKNTERTLALCALETKSFIGLTASREHGSLIQLVFGNMGLRASAPLHDTRERNGLEAAPDHREMHDSRDPRPYNQIIMSIFCRNTMATTRDQVQVVSSRPAPATHISTIRYQPLSDLFRALSQRFPGWSTMGEFSVHVAQFVHRALVRISFGDAISLGHLFADFAHQVQITETRAAARQSATAQSGMNTVDEATSVFWSQIRGEHVCPVCLLEKDGDEDDAEAGADVPWWALMPCLHTVCGGCLEHLRSGTMGDGGRRRVAPAQTRCPMCRTLVRHVSKVEEDPAPGATGMDLEDEAEETKGGAEETKSGGGVEESKDDGSLLGNSTSSKIPSLIQRLQQIRERGEKAIVMCEGNHGTVKRIVRALANAGLRTSSLAGTMTHPQREKSLAKFRAEDCDALVMTYRTGGVGLNLECANHVVLFNLPSRSDFIPQAIGRVDRIGQTRQIYVHPILYENSIETEIWNAWHVRGENVFLTRLVQALA